jgi:hypothetical protein
MSEWVFSINGEYKTNTYFESVNLLEKRTFERPRSKLGNKIKTYLTELWFESDRRVERDADRIDYQMFVFVVLNLPVQFTD